MDLRIDLPRVLAISPDATIRSKSTIRSVKVARNSGIQHMEYSLSISHYICPLLIGDILADNGAPFVTEPQPILLYTPDETLVLYYPIRLTGRQASVQRFVLRLLRDRIVFTNYTSQF